MRILSKLSFKGVRSGVGEAVGKRGRRVISLLDDQLDATARGTRLAIAMSEGKTSRPEARREIASIEHEGDASRKKLVGILIGTFITPIDREDLYRLSRSVDDILDDMRDFVRESDLYQVATQERFIPLLAAVLDGVLALQKAVQVLGVDSQKASRYALSCRREANNLRNAFQHDVANLLDGELTMETLRLRELYHRLDMVTSRMYESSDSLNDGLWKRHYS